MVDNAISGVTALLFGWAKDRDFAGHDPHDILNAPSLTRVSNPLARLLSLQFGRRSPIDLRMLLRVPHSENPKALALFLSGLLRAREQATLEWSEEASRLAERLVVTMGKDGGWGYPFPWQSRTHFVPKYIPNIVTTAFVGNALIEFCSIPEICHSAPEIYSQCQTAILRACDYVLDSIPRTESAAGVAFGYTKDDPQIVFNASLLGAEFLVNAGKLFDREEFLDIARRAAHFAIQHQGEDGSWQYGLEPSQTWIDSFHTGFTIVSLKTIADALHDNEIQKAAQRGFDYYRKTFVEPDFAIKYYHNRRYPIDAHAIGQAMVTLCGFGDIDAAERVAQWAIQHMRSPQGYFYYQRHKLFTNRIAYMRWSNAWMFRGLAEVLSAEVVSAKLGNEKTVYSALSTQHFRRIWIDLENTPHVPFFIPIILDLEKDGCEIILTARDFAQTKELVGQAGLNAKIIGGEYGNSAIGKSIGIALRALQLAWYLKGRKITLAVGHGSRGLLFAARLLRMPSLTLYDYEGANVSLFNRLSTWVMTPEIVPFLTLEGLPKSKHLTYPGLKEEVYANTFEPDDNIITELGFDPAKIIVSVRPPSSTAHYRSEESFVLFGRIMQLLHTRNDVQVILMPRNHEQRSQLKKEWRDAANVIIPDHAVNGLNLLYHSDLVIGGGGTMNREAATLGVPVITIFKGAEGAVDRWLIENEKLIAIEWADEIVPFLLKRTPKNISLSGRTRDVIVDTLLQLAVGSKPLARL